MNGIEIIVLGGIIGIAAITIACIVIGWAWMAVSAFLGD